MRGGVCGIPLFFNKAPLLVSDGSAVRKSFVLSFLRYFLARFRPPKISAIRVKSLCLTLKPPGSDFWLLCNTLFINVVCSKSAIANRKSVIPRFPMLAANAFLKINAKKVRNTLAANNPVFQIPAKLVPD